MELDFVNGLQRHPYCLLDNFVPQTRYPKLAHFAVSLGDFGTPAARIALLSFALIESAPRPEMPKLLNSGVVSGFFVVARRTASLEASKASPINGTCLSLTAVLIPRIELALIQIKGISESKLTSATASPPTCARAVVLEHAPDAGVFGDCQQCLLEFLSGGAGDL